ncbi:hypothetical protein ACNFLF_005077, partial [Escherichia coli]
MTIQGAPSFVSWHNYQAITFFMIDWQAVFLHRSFLMTAVFLCRYAVTESRSTYRSISSFTSSIINMPST